MTHLIGPYPYKAVEISPCGECDGLDCDKCSYSKPEKDEENEQNKMQKEDESNYLLYPHRS